MASKRLIIRHAIVSLSFVLLYLLLNRPEVIFISRIGFVAWYPAVGLVMALLLGVSPWYALLVCLADSFAAKVIYAQPIMSFSSTVGSLGSALSYGAAAYMLRRSLPMDLGLRRRWDVARYVLLSAIAAVGAAIIGVACLIADGSIAGSEYKSSGIGWFLGDAIGLVGIAPFLLIHVFSRVRSWLSSTPSQARRSTREPSSPCPKFTLTAIVEAIGQALTIFAVLLVIFGFRGGRYDQFYLCFIPIVWIAMRQGILRIVTGLLAMNLGIVVAMNLFPHTAVVFNKIALLMFVLSIVGLIVGSEVSERYHLVIDLDRQTTYLNSLIQNSPLGIIVLDRQGGVELANSAFEKLFDYDRRELAWIDIRRLGAVEDEASDSAELIRQIFAGKALRRTIRHRQGNGRGS
jgi:two-component system sensor kinase FixL